MLQRQNPRVQEHKMKRVSVTKQMVIVIWGLFVLLTSMLSGCDGGAAIPPETHATNAAATLTAIVTTPSPIATAIPSETYLIQKLNEILQKGKVVDELSQTFDAKYQVLEVRFDKDTDGKIIYLQIESRCEFIRNEKCCTSERTFVVIANAMREAGKEIIKKMPETITHLHVSCKDRDGLFIGMVEVGWEDMKGYILGTVIGSQLGNRAISFPGQ